MSREEYLDKVKERVKDHFPKRNLELWDDEEWQDIINNMYDRFVAFTPEQQERLINEAGPKESFWDRVIGDGAYAFYLWA